MKKTIMAIIIIILMFSIKNVQAKDTVYTINKYKEEELKYIIKGYKGSKEDGYILIGTYKDKNTEDEENIKNKILAIKYDKTGNIIWKYDYDNEFDNKLVEIIYSYDSKSVINGYTIIVNKKEDNEKVKTVLVILNQNGKEIKEIELDISENTIVKKIIKTNNQEKINYIVVGTTKKNDKDVGFIAKYNSEYNKEWEKEYNEENATEISIEDIISVNDQFIAISKIKKEEESKQQLIKLSKDGEFLKVIKENFADKVEPSLMNDDDGYIVYGKTYEVKLNDKTESYYLKKFDNKDEIVWETIGNDSIDATKIVDIQKIEDGYLFLYVNGKDSSIEIVKIDKDGLIQNKIKKIKNEYYNINDFLYSKETIYFAGQIKCVKDETCDFVANSLFLISDKDRVIEVKDKDSKIIIVIILLVLSFMSYIGIESKRRKVMNKKEKVKI